MQEFIEKLPANSTILEPVYRGDGVRLYGLDAELEKKSQSKRDPNHERRLLEWIEECIGDPVEPKDDIMEALRNGIALCKLINIIRPATISVINTRSIALMEMENIGYYLKACWKLGVPSTDLFVVSDLYQKKRYNTSNK